MSSRLVLLGPPGAGKGTQAELLAAELGVPAISTGAIFRAHMKAGTPLGRQAKEIIEAGHLVPDEITNDMVRERLSEPDSAAGFLLDGYPRNAAQIEALDQMLAPFELRLDGVLELQIPEDVSVQRMLERAVKENRPDDTEDVIKERLAVYHRETEPISAIYRDRGVLRTVDGTGEIAEITKRLLQAVATLGA